MILFVSSPSRSIHDCVQEFFFVSALRQLTNLLLFNLYIRLLHFREWLHLHVCEPHFMLALNSYVWLHSEPPVTRTICVYTRLPAIFMVSRNSKSFFLYPNGYFNTSFSLSLFSIVYWLCSSLTDATSLLTDKPLSDVGVDGVSISIDWEIPFWEIPIEWWLSSLNVYINIIIDWRWWTRIEKCLGKATEIGKNIFRSHRKLAWPTASIDLDKMRQ